jgi:hypothetical protein
MILKMKVITSWAKNDSLNKNKAEFEIKVFQSSSFESEENSNFHISHFEIASTLFYI